MEKLVIIGAGGHARSVIDIFLQMHTYEIVGCLDPTFKNRKSVKGMEEIPVIGDDKILPQLREKGIEYVFVALGDNRLRKKLTKLARDYSYKVATAVSPGAYISKLVQIGEGTCIMAGAVLNVNSVIGEGTIINTNASLDHDCKIGNYVHIAPGTAVSGSTIIEEGTHLGTGASVIDGIHIGSWSYIGAGAVVVKNLPGSVLAYGVPAHVIRKINN